MLCSLSVLQSGRPVSQKMFGHKVLVPLSQHAPEPEISMQQLLSLTIFE